MFLGKEVRVFLREQAKESFIELKKRNDKESQSLVNSIERVIGILKQNPQFGEPLRKELIPENMKKEGIKNLYRVELSNYWRMLYTLEGTRIEVFAFILSIIDHPTYNKIFKYKNWNETKSPHNKHLQGEAPLLWICKANWRHLEKFKSKDKEYKILYKTLH